MCACLRWLADWHGPEWKKDFEDQYILLEFFGIEQQLIDSEWSVCLFSNENLESMPELLAL